MDPHASAARCLTDLHHGCAKAQTSYAHLSKESQIVILDGFNMSIVFNMSIYVPEYGKIPDMESDIEVHETTCGTCF